ncbi:hypothetical protein [Streptomyces sp. GSL17-111]|uniref:hypothetical protein n=1 Tax=Streptomyces sp. GSL17-111 TaxID=3121596 RepID=UPI0030F49289
MARSTIQDKISGKSSLNLLEVLSIVEALAEHARVNGTPLPPQEIAQGIWRERVTNFARNAKNKHSTHYAPAVTPEREIPWNLEALKLAQMYDLIEIVENSTETPTAFWLPQIVEPMLRAEMSVSDLMRRAAQDSPQSIVQTLAVLNNEFPQDKPIDPRGEPVLWVVSDNDRTVGSLLAHTARIHGTTSTPAIVVAMRRAEIEEHADAYLANIARIHPPKNIQSIVQQLRSATLSGDAKKILRHIGLGRRSNELIEIVTYLRKAGQEGDAKEILKAVAAGKWYRLKNVVDHIQSHESAEYFTRAIIDGIPWGEHSNYSKEVRKLGNKELAEKILAMANEPPF